MIVVSVQFRYVYKAKHKQTREVVALKKIRMEGQQQGVSVHRLTT